MSIIKKAINKKNMAALVMATIGFAGFSFAGCKDKTTNTEEGVDKTAKYTRELEEHYGDILLELNKISAYKVTEIHYVDAETKTVKENDKEVKQGEVKVYAKAAINSKGKTADYSFTFTGDATKAEKIKTSSDDIFNAYYEAGNDFTKVVEMAVSYVAEVSDYVTENNKNCEVVKESVETVYLQDGEANYTGYGVLDCYSEYLYKDKFVGTFGVMEFINTVADQLAPKQKVEETENNASTNSSESDKQQTQEKETLTADKFRALLQSYKFTTEIKTEIVEETKEGTEDKEVKYYATLTTSINGLSFFIRVDFTDYVTKTETEEIKAEIEAAALKFLKMEEGSFDVSKIVSVEMINVTSKTVWSCINENAAGAKLLITEQTNTPEV